MKSKNHQSATKLNPQKHSSNQGKKALIEVLDEDAIADENPSRTIAQQGRQLLNLLLLEQDESFRSRVLELVVQLGIDPEDPLFLVMIATGRLQVLLERSPEDLAALFEIWEGKVHDHLQSYEQMIAAKLKAQEDKLETYGRVAVKAQERSIAQSVSSLIRRVEFEKALYHAPTLLAACLALSGILAIGAVVGSVGVLWHQKVVGLDPTGARQLTLDQVKALQWAQSREGQYAKNLIDWNRDLLAERACTDEVTQLGITRTLEAGHKKATSGFCVLWIEPPAKRSFTAESKKR